MDVVALLGTENPGKKKKVDGLIQAAASHRPPQTVLESAFIVRFYIHHPSICSTFNR